MLAPLTTLGVGGSARFFFRAQSEAEIIAAVAWAQDKNLPVFILGGGSNVLIADQGFAGLVLQIGLRGLKISDDVVTAQAGEDWDEFVKLCVAKNLQGVECLSGIPGLVGGSPIQNIGAYGQEVSESIVKVRVFDRQTNKIFELANSDCQFSYRASIFNTSERNRFIVLAITFKLQKNGIPKIAYKDLRDLFGSGQPTLAETREAVLQIRRAKSMVIDKTDPNSRSAGSFFKNPIVSNETYQKIERMIENSRSGNVPKFEVNANYVKIPAAWLIEQSGFRKGYIDGESGISSRHSLALINRGAASAEDIVRLKDKIQIEVKKKFGIELQPEPIFVGF